MGDAPVIHGTRPLALSRADSTVESGGLPPYSHARTRVRRMFSGPRLLVLAIRNRSPEPLQPPVSVSSRHGGMDSKHELSRSFRLCRLQLLGGPGRRRSM